MSIFRRLLGWLSPSLPDPVTGRLYVLDDDDVVHVYLMTEADYNVYEQDGHHWLTVYVEAETKLKPDDDMNAEPHLELNLCFDKSPESRLRVGELLEAPSYDDALGNLTNMYHWSHSPFENAQINIQAVDGDALTVEVSGEIDGSDPVVLKAVLQRNRQRVRSFS